MATTPNESTDQTEPTSEERLAAARDEALAEMTCDPEIVRQITERWAK